jgi:hypothetical protein
MASLQVELENIAKTFLGDKAWRADMILRMGAVLAEAVNKAPGLSGQQKTDLVCQVILKLLEDAEKAEKGHEEGSNLKETSTVQWEDYKNIVKNLLPPTLDLIVSAARGKFDLQKAVVVATGCLPYCGLFCSCFSKKKVKKSQEKLMIRQVEVPLQSNPLLHNASQKPLKEQDTQVAVEQSQQSDSVSEPVK